MTRIIAGRWGGRRLATPRTDATRPTSDRTREALFSRLDHLGVVTGARVLDLFAGSGGLGLEALSRGAAHVTFVDSGRPALAALRENVTALRAAAGQAEVIGDRAERVLSAAPGEPVDLAFLDPPYALSDDELAALLARLARAWLAEDAVVVVERSSRSPEPAWPAELERFDQRRYGEATVWLAEPAAGQPPPPEAGR